MCIQIIIPNSNKLTQGTAMCCRFSLQPPMSVTKENQRMKHSNDGPLS